MTQDDVIHMAHIAGLTHYVEQHALFDARIFKLAQLVAAKEREACAKVCESEYDNWDEERERPLRIFATAIRARGGSGYEI